MVTDELIVWYKNTQRPLLSDGHILAKVGGIVSSGVYTQDRFVYDLLDFPPRDWKDVEWWAYFPKCLSE